MRGFQRRRSLLNLLEIILSKIIIITSSHILEYIIFVYIHCIYNFTLKGDIKNYTWHVCMHTVLIIIEIN